MSLTESDRERLASILERNRKLGADISERTMPDGHPLLEEVRKVVDEFREQGRTEFMARDVGRRIDHSSQGIGMALHTLRVEGAIEAVDSTKQAPYRWVVVE